MGKYVSLRNESYCKDENEEYVYSPNDKGWNSAKHKIPFNWIQIFMIRYSLIYKKKKMNNLIIILSILFLLITLIFYNYY